MDARQEIFDVFDGRGADVPPPAVFTQTATVGQMEASGIFWPEANFDAVLMKELALQFNRMFGFPTVRVPFCGTIGAERLGAEIGRGRTDSQPSVINSPYRTPMGVSEVPDDLIDPEEFASGGRCLMVQEACSMISGENPGLFLSAGMDDPLALAMQLLGAENLMLAHMMEPGLASAWLDAIVPRLQAYGERLSESADNVTVVCLASTDLLSPEMSDELSRPYISKVVSSLKSSCSTIHACGDTLGVIDNLVSAGADALSLEASHCPERYLDAVGGRCRMFGSVDPIGTLLMGSPADVLRDARRYAEIGFDAITPECGIPPRTPDENLIALAGCRDRL